MVKSLPKNLNGNTLKIDFSNLSYINIPPAKQIQIENFYNGTIKIIGNSNTKT